MIFLATDWEAKSTEQGAGRKKVGFRKWKLEIQHLERGVAGV
jgi:hypothetical protein